MIAMGATGADHVRLGGSGARSLRHHALWLLASGADLKGVMERMGHTQFQTTQEYQHTLPDADQKNLDAFSRVADGRIQVIPAQQDAPLTEVNGPSSVSMPAQHRRSCAAGAGTSSLVPSVTRSRPAVAQRSVCGGLGIPACMKLEDGLLVRLYGSQSNVIVPVPQRSADGFRNPPPKVLTNRMRWEPDQPTCS
jgi:hypothetical protein